MDRDGIGAWVASLGDHSHAPILRLLLADYDRLAGRVDALGAELRAEADARTRAEANHAVALLDADRLARWIIQHPSEHNPAEVLNLHDRATR